MKLTRFTLQVIKDGKVKLTVPNCTIHPGGYPVYVDTTHPDYECDPDARSEETGKLIPFVSRAACEAAGKDPKKVQADSLENHAGFENYFLRMGTNPDGNLLVDWKEKEAKERADWEAENPVLAAQARARELAPQPFRFRCEDCGDTVWSGTSCWETGLKHRGPDGSQMPEPLDDISRREAALENACEAGQIPGAAAAD